MDGILRIKEILKERGMTSEKLAESIGVSPVTVSRILSGKSGTNLSTLIDIAKVLEVEIRELFTGPDETTLYVKDGTQYKPIGFLRQKKEG